MAKLNDLKTLRTKGKVRRKGRHNKSDSKIKSSKTYKKKYSGQGR